MNVQCDILVVGGGPAGTAAARAAARRNARVLLVERRTVIGTPVQCAEYIPAMLMGKLELGRRYVAQSIKGMKTYRNDGSETYTPAPGYIIHRELFDQTLARAAEDAGVHIMTATRAVERWSSGAVILKQKNGRYIKIKPWIIIGADGPRSTVGRWVGAVNNHLLPGVQVTMELARPMQHTEVYFHPDIYAGYGWLFPKGQLANVGLGLKRNGRSAERIRSTLNAFARQLKTHGKIKGDPVAYAAGWIPAEPVRKAVYHRIALVGDAAGHTHPITGAGIFAAVVGGRMAGKWAGRAVKEKDAALLARYDDEWRDLMGDTHHRAYQRRIHMEHQWSDFSATVQRCWVAYREYYG
ncbi:MAG: NAD(P)/FAD-dependent oxidoreductase [Desulfobacteraceae bacterium]